MKLIRRKRTPKIKIEEMDLKNFPKLGTHDPYWNDLYNPSTPKGAQMPNEKNNILYN